LHKFAHHLYNNKLIKQLYLDEFELKAVLIVPEGYREGSQHSSQSWWAIDPEGVSL
jgi:hypothetical protein